MRKGMIEVQFNIIFVLIAGAIILAFFFTIVQKQKQISEDRLSFSLIKDLNTISTVAQVSRGTAQVVDIPDIGIDFECFADCGQYETGCEFRIKNQHVDYKDKQIFAPARLEGRHLMMWTLDWKMPFRITNFLFLTNENVRYILITDPSIPSSPALRDKIMKLMPDAILVDVITSDEVSFVKKENYPRTRFVFLDIPSGSVNLDPSFKHSEVSAVQIISKDQSVQFFNLETLNKKKLAATSSYYLTDEMLFAAVFSENALTYECNMKSAMQRFSQVAKIYAKRSDALNKETSEGEGCVHNVQLIHEISTEAEELASDIHSIEHLTVLLTDIAKLQQHNENLIRTCKAGMSVY